MGIPGQCMGTSQAPRPGRPCHPSAHAGRAGSLSPPRRGGIHQNSLLHLPQSILVKCKSQHPLPHWTAQVAYLGTDYLFFAKKAVKWQSETHILLKTFMLWGTRPPTRRDLNLQSSNLDRIYDHKVAKYLRAIQGRGINIHFHSGHWFLLGCPEITF